MIEAKTTGLLLQLINNALNSDSAIEIPADADWQEALDLAIAQGVMGLCFEAVEKLPADQRPPLEMLMQWYGHTEQQCSMYEHTWAVACKLDRLWAAEGIQATVLKGRSIAKYYPVPSHRYSCDLDVFIGSDWGRACELLENKGVRKDREYGWSTRYIRRWNLLLMAFMWNVIGISLLCEATKIYLRWSDASVHCWTTNHRSISKEPLWFARH